MTAAQTRQCDVAVVGARCAGSSLATWLAEAGVDVVLIERAVFPSDTVSTHLFEGHGIAALHRLGVLDAVRATGAPAITQARGLFDADVELTSPLPSVDGLEPALCVRRSRLDAILAERAQQAGAELVEGTARSLLTGDGRVRGVRVQARGGGTLDVRARVVVGADGMHSTTARLVGARRYHVLPNERFCAYAYFEGVPPGRTDAVTLVRRGVDQAFACPTDDGLLLVCLLPDLDEARAFRSAAGEVFDAEVARVPELAALTAGATRVSEPRIATRLPAFFRESAGPGWVLVGDAGHFKNPAPGQGIADAFRQAETLAKALPAALAEGDEAVDKALQRYWRWRDADGRNRHFWAHDMGRAGVLGPVRLEMLRRMAGQPDGARLFWEPVGQVRDPSEVLTPWRAMAATLRLLLRRRTKRVRVLAESWTLGWEYLGRGVRILKPKYEQDDAEADTALLVAPDPAGA